MERWNPARELSRREQLIIKRLKRTRKLFAFLRLHRHELFDESFQDELEGMYRQTGAGTEPVAPGLLCMTLLLQAYLGTSDAEAVELSIVDLRWQLVLGCLGAESPAFSQNKHCHSGELFGDGTDGELGSCRVSHAVLGIRIAVTTCQQRPTSELHQH